MSSLDPYFLQPLTLLDAVNVVLANIGSGAVLSLDSIDMNSDAEDALKQVHNWSIQVQQDSWWFNVEKNLKLDPTTDGSIVLPLGTLKVDTVGISAGKDLVQRGNKLYDRLLHTYAIGEAVYCDLVVALDFEEMPQAARHFVTIKAARQFAQVKLNNGATNQFTRENEQEAYLKLLEASDEADDTTLLDTNARLARRRLRFNQG
jgi:hypothetical protein